MRPGGRTMRNGEATRRRGDDGSESEPLLSTRQRRRLRAAGRMCGVGAATGLLGGLGLYVYGRPTLSPLGPGPAPLALVALAGLYAHWFSRGLREGIGAAGVAYLFGAFVSTLLWSLPLVVLDYGMLAGLRLQAFLRDAFADVVVVYLLVLGASYLSAVVLGQLLEA